MAALSANITPAALGKRSRALAAIQVLQVGTGLLGQVLLLARWSPDRQTDLFLLLSSVPWLVSAAALVTGLEMALPAAYHRALNAEGESGARNLLDQTRHLSLLASIAAALISGLIVAGWAVWSDLPTRLSLWMGAAMGIQVIPATLGGLWRGLLVAHDDLIRARLTLLAGSILTAVGYGVLPGSPALALPLTAACAMTLTALLAGYAKPRLPTRSAARMQERKPVRKRALFVQEAHPEIMLLIRALAGLSAAAGLVHLQAIIERAAVQPLGTGTVTALAAAARGWDAVLAVIVAAGVMPVYARWASSHAGAQHARILLRWSLRRACFFSGLAGGAIGIAAWQIGPRLDQDLGWEAGSRAAEMALVLLPRFVLVSCAQPLILKHYASGTPWYPVAGAALGVGVLVIGVRIAVPCYDLAGFMLATAASAIPGWLVLGWYEIRNAP